MYVKPKVLKAVKIITIIMLIIAGIQLVLAVPYIVSEFAYYADDPATAWSAVSMKECIVMTIVSIIFIIAVFLLRRMVWNANFYSSYFEGSLDGLTKYQDLADVTGYPASRVKSQLTFYLKFLMKGFKIQKENVELDSKKVLCECKNCAAGFEKRIFFTGKCPYCGSSDLRAKIIAEGKFYSISHDDVNAKKAVDYYKDKNLGNKQILFNILGFIGVSVCVILFIVAFSTISHYNDQEYLRKVLLDPESTIGRSYDLIKKDMVNNFLYDFLIALILTPFTILRLRKANIAGKADAAAECLKKMTKPYIPQQELPADLAANKLKSFRNGIKYRYIRHAALEVHEDQLTIAVGKKIVKDTCPSCGASITDPVDETYACKYCGNRIMNTVVKD